MSHDLRISARNETQNKFKIEGGSKLEVFDEDGKLLHAGEFKSFTANFLKLLYGSMIGSGTAKVKDLTNSNIEMDSFPQNTFNISGGAGVKKFGLVVGTNSTAVLVSDYNITVPAGLTVNDTVVSASSVGADSISVEISRQIGNSSGSAVNLKEAGLICGSEDETDTNVLIARDLLDLTLENSKKTTWHYTINFNFANDKGGFVKTFADLMFNGIFREATSSAQWDERLAPFIVFNNKMWVLGGLDSVGVKNDVWYSSDGITWIRATSSAQWSARSIQGTVVFNNKMWVMGGNTSSARVNDVWYSSDGITWTRATSSAQWSARNMFGCVVYDNKMWVMGGTDSSNTRLNDVWYSSDGITWIQATSSAPWSARTAFGCAVYDNKMWVLGGRSNLDILHDVWYSSDGITWIRATSSAQWSARDSFSCVVYDNKMWVLGGRSNLDMLHDVWYSSDGITWTRATSSAQWSARNIFGASFVFNNKIWVLGGYNGVSFFNDIWSFNLFVLDLRVGSFDSAFSATATALGAEIANGSGSGQLVYGTMPSSATQEPTVSSNKTKMSIAREFANNSGADITVREVGLFSGADMLARLILATPVTIPNGGSEIITVDFETEV